MRLLLIVSGSIAVKKSSELIKKFTAKNIKIDCIFTKSSLKLIKLMKIDSFKKCKIYSDKDLFKNNNFLHIDLARKADAILVFPASANIIGKYANGIADDLASTTLLASNKQIFVAPAMNVQMWENPANIKNVIKLSENGINFIGPIIGNLSCGEYGYGRLAEINDIVEELEIFFKRQNLLSGLSGIITSGPTIEPIDGTRFISNYSSGKQGYAIAKILSMMGAKIKLISGPSNINKPNNIDLIKINSADEMYKASMDLLPTDFAICAAAVADFKPSNFSFSKKNKKELKSITLKQNPDILYEISNSKNKRPDLVVGFAAETTNIKSNCRAKLKEKNCDWILANKITKKNSVFGNDTNLIHYITKKTYEKWPRMSKIQVAKELNQRIVNFFEKNNEK